MKHLSQLVDHRSLRVREFVALLLLQIASGCSDPPSPPPAAATPLEAKPENRIYEVGLDDLSFSLAVLSRPGTVVIPRPSRESDTPAVPSQGDYVGPDACRECHAEYVESCALTAHVLTTRLPDEQSILGDIEPPGNAMETAADNLEFRMTKKDGRFFQGAYRPGDLQPLYAASIDLVTGSGKSGQSYLHWEQDRLYQLPVSYFADVDRWLNSPGYADGSANFARPAPGQCLDCHSTWFQQVPESFHRFAREGYVLGVTCEKCHGPGRKHVTHHRAHPDDVTAVAIANPSTLSRERSLDLCGLCHSGSVAPLQPAFEFRPGEVLSEYVEVQPSADEGPGGVHTANQLARLKLSRCFQDSPDMTCTSCHNPHEFERGRNDLFSLRCRKCHDVQSCPPAVRIGTPAHDQCIRCHMPARHDQYLQMVEGHATFMPEIRDHFITVWPDASQDAERELLSQ